MRNLRRFRRPAAVLCSAGILLQTGACAVDVNSLVSGLATTIATSYISNLVFAAFNLAP